MVCLHRTSVLCMAGAYAAGVYRSLRRALRAGKCDDRLDAAGRACYDLRIDGDGDEYAARGLAESRHWWKAVVAARRNPPRSRAWKSADTCAELAPPRSRYRAP